MLQRLWHLVEVQFSLVSKTGLAAVLANVSHRKSTPSWSSVRFRDLSYGCRQVLLYQVAVIAVDCADGVVTTWIRRASLRHVWMDVGKLCLTLLPADSSSVLYPAEHPATTFATSSRSSGTSSSLNLSSFHFGPDIDVTQLLQDGSQKKLRSFSASPCGLHRSSALRRLAQSCPDFQALVVRIDSRDRNLHSAGCSGDYSL
ncbi:hypothetical protein HPB51_000893 [Rhipicephalus microplus]|uniref:Uncharacterized protein n=1 Tax=Rhipicephalus microplus TaxID=6941 RepID=A0A9J6DL37_RHIMP|nr:hypothetical protein HPB51_000893 [Rhipicephalus microplus]